MATIELGELASAEPPGSGPEMSVPTRRMLLAVVVAVACLFGLAGSARVRPGLTTPLWSGPVSLVGYTLGERSLYLAEPSGRVVVARDLITGVERWRLDINALPMETVDAGNGVAAVQTRIPGPGGQGSSVVVLVRDSTGEVMGRTAGSALGPSATGHRLLLLDTAELRDDTCPVYGLPCVDLVSVDTWTGAEVGRLSLAGDERFAVSTVEGHRASFATYRPGGTLRIFDVGSGELLDAMAMPAGAGDVTLTSDGLLTARRTSEGVEVAAYARGPLRPLWKASVPAPGDAENSPLWVGEDCGPVVCVQVDDRTILLDHDTGRTRFTYDGFIGGGLGDGALVGYRPRREPGRQGPVDIHVLDPVSGAIRSSVPGATGVGWADRDGRLLLAQPGAVRTAFVVIERDGSLRPLGSVDGVGLNCLARADVLACASPSGLLRVWPMPVG